MTLKRCRKLLAAMLALSLIAAACSGDEDLSEATTIQIGVPIALSGPIALQAQGMVNGYDLYMAQNGGLLGGIPAEFLIEDTEADPNMVISKTRKLIQNDGVHLIAGGALALESLAIIDLAVEEEIAFITPISSADDLTQRNQTSIFARPNMTSSQPNLYFGEWAATEGGFKKVAIIAQDYAYGWESAGGFQYAFEQSGGEVVQKLWVPLDNTDPAPFIRQIDESVDAVYFMVIGGFIPQFIKAFDDFGLNDTIQIIGGPDTTDEDALPAMGDEELGIITVHEYNSSLDTAQDFVADYTEAYGVAPSYWADSTYVTAWWLDETIQKVRDDNDLNVAETADWIRDNAEEFISTFKGIELKGTARGDLSLDEFGNVNVPLYVFEVTGPDTNTVIAELGDSNQFWTLGSEEFLDNPVFSREFPE
jgi:branched-chain amino acid transport system substrate-binding protein